ncbi:MAG: CDP-glycerol glycerophosphotransferase family protein [Clostridia bacterium]|nr:CDP-glycerol glycerophosphotransferase family protein [Clostridia bacterium]
MLSRQSNKVNIDFNYIEKEILRRNKNVEVKILCKVLKNGSIARLEYCFYILKCMYHIATAKVCILDGYSIPISILKHKKDLKIIQIWHASGAIKKFGYQSINKKEGRGEEISRIMKMHRNYTYVISPSKATAKFYAEAFSIDEDKIIINGLPRLDYIIGNEESVNKTEKFYKEYPKYKDKKIILYVPTFRKDFDSSIYIKKLIENINFSKYDLIIKLHPLDKSKRLLEYSVDAKYNTYDLIRVADYIITDYSAVAFETSVLVKPIYFYVYDIEHYEKSRGLNVNLFEEMKNGTSKNIVEIIQSIENNRYDFGELEEFKNKYMEDSYYDSTVKLVEFIFKCLEKDIDDEKIKNHIKESRKEKFSI